MPKTSRKGGRPQQAQAKAERPPTTTPDDGQPAHHAALAKIAEEAIGLYRFYPEAAKQHDRAKRHRQLAVEGARRYGWDLYTDPSGPDLQLQIECCDRHWQTLSWLRVAVAGSFPGLHLRLVPMAGEPWHQQDDFDWPAACTELQRIVDAAVHAMEAKAVPETSGAMIPFSQVARIFGLNRKQLDSLIERNKIATDRKDQNGRPHGQRRRVDLLATGTAIMGDVAVSSDPIRLAKIRGMLQRAEIDRNLQTAAEKLLGK